MGSGFVALRRALPFDGNWEKNAMKLQRRSFALDDSSPHMLVLDGFRGRWKQSLARYGFGLAIMLGLIAPDSAHADGCVPQITLTEQVVEEQPGGSLLGQYVMTTGDLCGMQIVALAVDNDESLATFSSLSGWNSLVVTDNFWDAGIVLSRDDFGTGSSYRVTTGPAGIGSFVSFFGPFAELANLYWLSAHYGGPVVDNSTAFTAVGAPILLSDDAFQFQARAPASQPVFFLFDPSANTTVAVSAAVSAIPEPTETLLLATGLLLMIGRMRLAREKTAG